MSESDRAGATECNRADWPGQPAPCDPPAAGEHGTPDPGIEKDTGRRAHPVIVPAEWPATRGTRRAPIARIPDWSTAAFGPREPRRARWRLPARRRRTPQPAAAT